MQYAVAEAAAADCRNAKLAGRNIEPTSLLCQASTCVVLTWHQLMSHFYYADLAHLLTAWHVRYDPSTSLADPAPPPCCCCVPAGPNL
jgi:hypothetical protein